MRRTGRWIAATWAMICLIAFCAAGVASGREKARNAEWERWYREREAALLADTKAYLTGMGFRDSGVTLNRVVDGRGDRTYTFTIHHRRIDKMSEEERQKLCGDLRILTEGFAAASLDESCTFCYDFLN